MHMYDKNTTFKKVGDYASVLWKCRKMGYGQKRPRGKVVIHSKKVMYYARRLSMPQWRMLLKHWKFTVSCMDPENSGLARDYLVSLITLGNSVLDGTVDINDITFGKKIGAWKCGTLQSPLGME